jgi:hypothetical protein
VDGAAVARHMLHSQADLGGVHRWRACLEQSLHSRSRQAINSNHQITEGGRRGACLVQQPHFGGAAACGQRCGCERRASKVVWTGQIQRQAAGEQGPHSVKGAAAGIPDCSSQNLPQNGVRIIWRHR